MGFSRSVLWLVFTISGVPAADFDGFRLGSTTFARRSSSAARNVTPRCATDPNTSADAFTATRAYPTDPTNITMALILAVSTIGEDPPLRHILEELVVWWPGWRSRFLPRVPYLVLVMVVEYHPDVLAHDIAHALNLTLAECEAASNLSGLPLLRTLDAGYEVFTPADDPGAFYLLISFAKFPAPKWVTEPQGLLRRQTSLEEVARTWRDPLFHYPYQYIAMNTWYTYHGLQLDLLDYFDYWLKIDYDVVWSEDMTHDLRKLFFDARALFIHTEIGHDPPEMVKGVATVRNDFLAAERRRCGGRVYPRAVGQPFYEDPSSTFYGNFIGGWLGFLTSPEVAAFGKLWNASPFIWKRRWGDQQFWCQALGLFHNGSRLLDLSHWRNRLFWHHPTPKGDGHK
jgi:hypothetical protein